MGYVKETRMIGVLGLLFASAIAFSSPAAGFDDDGFAPDFRASVCDALQVPKGNKLALHVYASGAQIYRWDGTGWKFVAPVARLFADPGYQQDVGVHYVGPTWESYSGSRVVGSVMGNCVPDPNAIPWLLLRTVSTAGPGVFSSVSYIQRVNTMGGLAPTAPGSYIGVTVDVPYTAEYYFFRPKE